MRECVHFETHQPPTDFRAWPPLDPRPTFGGPSAKQLERHILGGDDPADYSELNPCAVEQGRLIDLTWFVANPRRRTYIRPARPGDFIAPIDSSLGALVVTQGGFAARSDMRCWYLSRSIHVVPARRAARLGRCPGEPHARELADLYAAGHAAQRDEFFRLLTTGHFSLASLRVWGRNVPVQNGGMN